MSAINSETQNDNPVLVLTTRDLWRTNCENDAHLHRQLTQVICLVLVGGVKERSCEDSYPDVVRTEGVVYPQQQSRNRISIRSDSSVRLQHKSGQLQFGVTLRIPKTIRSHLFVCCVFCTISFGCAKVAELFVRRTRKCTGPQKETPLATNGQDEHFSQPCNGVTNLRC